MKNFRKHMENEHPCILEKLDEMEKKISSGGGAKVNTVTLHKNDFQDATIMVDNKLLPLLTASFGYTDSGEKIENAYNHIFRMVENTYNERGELIKQTPFLLTSYEEMTLKGDLKKAASITVDSNVINVTIYDSLVEPLPANVEYVLSFI